MILDDFAWWAAKWWLAALFGAVVALLRWAYARQKKKTKETKAYKDAVVAIMYDRMTQAYNYYAQLGYCPMQARHNLGKMFKAYQMNGGNDNMEDLLERLYELPMENQK